MANEYSISNLDELRRVLNERVKVYYVDATTKIWYRILGVDAHGRSKLLVLMPCDEFYFKPRNPHWRLSWDAKHKGGRVRETYANLFDKRAQVTKRLPTAIVKYLEANGCLRFMDDDLFK